MIQSQVLIVKHYSGKVIYDNHEFRIKPAEESSVREGYTGYGDDPEEHRIQQHKRIVKMHEIFPPPVYDHATNSGHVSTGIGEWRLTLDNM